MVVLAELLLKKDYEVTALSAVPAASTAVASIICTRIVTLVASIIPALWDLSDSVSLVKLLYELKPDEIYHLGAQSHVRVSFDIPEYTANVTAVGTIRILEAIREAGRGRVSIKLLRARCSARCRNPATGNHRFTRAVRTGLEGVSYWATVNYARAIICLPAMVMFNHESPRRGETFVTRKITRAVAHIKLACNKGLPW